MGRTAAITFEQVVATAEELHANGRTPTAKLIRPMLGNIGSLGTIQKYLEQWRGQQGEDSPAARMLPAELQRKIFDFVNDEVGRANSELKRELHECKDALNDFAVDGERQDELVRHLQTELVEQTTTKAEQDGRLARLLDELDAARTETAQERYKVELARIELASLQARLEACASLENEIRELRKEVNAQREACVRAEQSTAVLATEKNYLEARLSEMKSTASTHVRTHGVDGHGAGASKPEHSQRSNTNGGLKGSQSAFSDPSGISDLSGPSASDEGDLVDPRQGKLY